MTLDISKWKMAHLLKFTIYIFLFTTAASGFNKNTSKINVGTVLFTESDVSRHCWSSDSLALLSTRLMLQDLLPAKSALNMIDGDFVSDIIEYFRLILEVIRELAVGKSKHILLLALTDVLGGYLNHMILPIAKFTYYAGNIDYASMEKLYDLFDELKSFLRTDGKTWKDPVTLVNNGFHIEKITITPAAVTALDPCMDLVYMEEQGQKSQSQTEIKVPMPFFDTKKYPTAVALPFKTTPLRALEGRDSSYLLIKYFITVHKCMSYKQACIESVKSFNNEFFAWMTKTVVGHFKDERFYSAFGAALRILETLKQTGAGGGGKQLGNYNIMKESVNKEDHMPDDGSFIELGTSEKENSSTLIIILIGLLIAILVWVCLASIFICCRIRRQKKAAQKGKGELKELEMARWNPPDVGQPVEKQSSSSSTATPTTSTTSRDNQKNVQFEPSDTNAKKSESYDSMGERRGSSCCGPLKKKTSDLLYKKPAGGNKTRSHSSITSGFKGKTDFDEESDGDTETEEICKKDKCPWKRDSKAPETKALFLSSQYGAKRSKPGSSVERGKKTPVPSSSSDLKASDAEKSTTDGAKSSTSRSGTTLEQNTPPSANFEGKTPLSTPRLQVGNSFVATEQCLESSLKYGSSSKEKNPISEKSSITSNQPAFGYDFETTSSDTTPRE